MKKILYIVANSFLFRQKKVGGNVSSANGVIKSFRDIGYSVDVLSDDAVPGLDNESSRIITIYFNFSHFRFFLTKYFIGDFIRKVFLKLENYFFQKIMSHQVNKLFNENSYEYCYVRASIHSHIIAKLAKQHKVKLIVEVNKPLSMTPYNTNDIFIWPKNKSDVFIPDTEKTLYDTAKMISVDSSLRAKWIIDFVGNYKDKILINPNGVDVEKFKPDENNQKIRDLLGFSSSDIVVGMASSFRWYNDLNELFEIIKYTIKKNLEVKFLLIVGDKKKAKDINSIIKKNNLLNFVKMSVEIPFSNMPSYLNICDICLSHFNFHKKWPHNCSIKHLEYLALGKPVVATNVGEVNFAIEHNVNGYLCKEGMVQEYVDAIDSLAQKPELRKKLGISGRRKAISELTWKKNVQRILEFI